MNFLNRIESLQKLGAEADDIQDTHSQSAALKTIKDEHPTISPPPKDPFKYNTIYQKKFDNNSESKSLHDSVDLAARLDVIK